MALEASCSGEEETLSHFSLKLRLRIAGSVLWRTSGALLIRAFLDRRKQTTAAQVRPQPVTAASPRRQLAAAIASTL